MVRNIGGPVKLTRAWRWTKESQSFSQAYIVNEEMRRPKNEFEKILQRIEGWRKKRLWQGDFDIIVRDIIRRLQNLWIEDISKIHQEAEKLKKKLWDK